MLGYAPEEVIGRSGFDFVVPDDRERIAGELARVLGEAGAVVAAEYSARCRDGSRRLLSAVAQNLLDDPAVAGVVLNAQDITMRRQAEARFAHIAEHVPGMVYQYALYPDGTGKYTFVSEGVRRLFGVAPSDALRDPDLLLRLLHPDDDADFRVQARRAAADSRPFRWQGRAVLPDGEQRFIQVVSHSEPQPDGSVLSDGVITDVTALHDAARRLEEREQHYRSLFERNPDAVFSLD